MVVRWRQGALPSVENLRCNINNNSVNIGDRSGPVIENPGTVNLRVKQKKK